MLWSAHAQKLRGMQSCTGQQPCLHSMAISSIPEQRLSPPHKHHKESVPKQVRTGPQPNHAPSAPPAQKEPSVLPATIVITGKWAMPLKPLQSAQLSETLHSSFHFLKQKNISATYSGKLLNSLTSSFESNLPLHTTKEGKLLLSQWLQPALKKDSKTVLLEKWRTRQII